MAYPKTGNEVYVSFSISNTMLEGLGKSTVTREPVSADYLRELFMRYGATVSAKPNQRQLLELVNERCGLELEIPERLQIVQLSEKNRRLVVITTQGLRRSGGSLLPSYTDEELMEVTFGFDKFYVQTRHYDDLVKENESLRSDLESEREWRERAGDL